MNRLTTMDYIHILDFYELKIPLNQEGKNNRQKIKQMAEDILATKLCRCIKKVRAKQNNKKDESRPIAICKQSIFKNRNLNISRFTCKKKPGLLTKKGEKNKLFKKGRLNITIKKKRG